MPDYLAAGGITWEEVKAKLEDTTNKNVDIRRLQLEYPTEDVSFAYLAAIDKLSYGGYPTGNLIVTDDSFTDKAIEGVTSPQDYALVVGRLQDIDNLYFCYLAPGLSTADHKLMKRSGGSNTALATESVDIGLGSTVLCMSCVGSTIKSMRYAPTDAIKTIADVTPDGIISATDTTFASGRFGIRECREQANHGFVDPITARLIAPQTRLPKSKAIIEVDVTTEKAETSSPVLKQELIEINKLDKIPEHLKQEAKRYEILKKKGWSDEEIKEVFGDMQTHVDLASVTWGAFDHKEQHNTMLITITGGNAYTGDKAITEQIEHAKRKNLKVVKPPRDYYEACRIYNELRKEFSEWIAGKDNFAYMTLGHEDFEAMQVADTYHGNIIDGIKPDAYKNVPEFEMRRTLNMWKERLKRAKVMKQEAQKHIEKIEKVERVGW